jgi:hypothetical protein
LFTFTIKALDSGSRSGNKSSPGYGEEARAITHKAWEKGLLWLGPRYIGSKSERRNPLIKKKRLEEKAEGRRYIR